MIFILDNRHFLVLLFNSIAWLGNSESTAQAVAPATWLPAWDVEESPLVLEKNAEK
jgi:hypothetical protein